VKPYSARLCLMRPFLTLPFPSLWRERPKERETDSRSHADLFHSCCSAQWGEAVIEQTNDVFDLQTACSIFRVNEMVLQPLAVFLLSSLCRLVSCSGLKIAKGSYSELVPFLFEILRAIDCNQMVFFSCRCD